MPTADRQNIFDISELDMDLRGHIQTQDPFRIGNFEAGIVENRIIHFLWRRKNIFQRAFVACLRIAQYGKPCFLPKVAGELHQPQKPALLPAWCSYPPASEY